MDNQGVVTEEKAREIRNRYLGEDLVTLLTAPTPEEYIDTRSARGGSSVSYVAGHHFIERLNECFGFFWNYEVLHQFELNGQIVVKGELSVTIPGRTISIERPDGKKESISYDAFTIKKNQFGSSEIKKYSKDIKNSRTGIVLHKAGDIIDLGDDYKGAATDAMKKCATLFGMFLDIYASRSTEESGGVSKEQYKAFYWRAEEAGMDEKQAEIWASEKLDKSFGDTDQLEIMGLVPALIDLAKEKKDKKE